MMEVESTNFEILEGAEVEPFLDKIGKFLYDVYINELDWKFGADNPSKITIEMDGQDNKMLVDKFMKDKDFIQKTTWFVATNEDKSEVIGCQRVIFGTEVELTRYAHRSPAIKEFLAQHQGSKMIEGNRWAIHRQYRNQHMIVRIGRETVKWFKQQGLHLSACPVIGTKSLDALDTLPIKALALKPFGDPFKYEDHDPYPVQLFVTNSCDYCKNYDMMTHRFGSKLKNDRVSDIDLTKIDEKTK